jgi:hypothetical protein
MVLLIEITKIWQKSKICETSGSRFFSRELLNPWAGKDFSMDFWLFLMRFINFLFKVITNLKFYKQCLFKDHPSEAFLYHRIVSCAHDPPMPPPPPKKFKGRPYEFKNL